jgi:hypothetical protein
VTATLADLLSAGPLARRIADTALRYASDFDLPNEDWPLMAAARILADPTLADALAAADVVTKLDSRHTPRRWNAESDVTVCDSCSASWPCETRQILDGQPVERDQEIR